MRAATTLALHAAADQYLVKQMYSCHHEVGLVRWGKRKADVFAFNNDLDTVIIEIKSGAPDFDGDRKWVEYIPYCHRMYFLIHHLYWDSAQADRMRAAAKEHGVGILVLMPNGKVASKQKCVRRDTLPQGWIKQVIVKLAWRLGNHRGNTRRVRGVFVVQDQQED